MSRKRAGAMLVMLGALAATGEARATYSLTAVDRETGAVGGAGASCVPFAVDLIFGAVPGRGALNAQAEFDQGEKDEALRLLETGLGPMEVVSRMTDEQAFPRAAHRQWGIVDTRGVLARATGAEALRYAGDREVRTPDQRFAATVQGNWLTSERVLEHAAAAFAGSGCDLEERLMLALEAASTAGEGDARCTPEGRSANSAYLNVTLPNGDALHLSVPDVSPRDPIIELRLLYDDYRRRVPCPHPSEPPREPERQVSHGCSFVPSPVPPWRALLIIAAALALKARRAAGARHPVLPRPSQ